MPRRIRALALPLAYLMVFLGAPDPLAPSARANGPGPDNTRPGPPFSSVTAKLLGPLPTPTPGCPAGSIPPGSTVYFQVTVVTGPLNLDTLQWAVTAPAPFTTSYNGIGFPPNPVVPATIVSKPVPWTAPKAPPLLILPTTFTITIQAYPPAPAAPVTITLPVTVC